MELAIGIHVMVTFNVETDADLDIANGSQGKITKIVLDERETEFSPTAAIVELTYPPVYVLIKLNHTKVVQLDGLEKNILPLVPMGRTFTIIHGNHPKSIRRRQNLQVEIKTTVWVPATTRQKPRIHIRKTLPP